VWRIRFEVDFEDEPFFFDEEYKKYLSHFFKMILKDTPFVFSDIIPMKKKPVSNGFWALKRAALILNTPFQDFLPDIATKIVKTPVDFKYGSLIFERAIFQKVRFETTGYLLSPVRVVLPTGENLMWEQEPARYSEALRQDLIEKYVKLYGKMPEDNRFLFSFINGFELEEADSEFISYRGRFMMFGSEELISVAYLLGIGSLNEMGYGMISHELYIWKKNQDKGSKRIWRCEDCLL
jgi:CRISPR-associated endoribonuclease Cas6